MTIGQFSFTLRTLVRLSASHGIFLFVDNTLPPSSVTFAELFDDAKKTKFFDGFVHIVYAIENTFGVDSQSRDSRAASGACAPSTLVALCLALC